MESIQSNTDKFKNIDSWEDIDCTPKLLRGIYAYGFEYPSPIQKKAINPFISGNDIIAQAQSGTGKTGCFTIGTLANIDLKLNKTQAIILSPVRELSSQTKNVLDSIGSFMKGLKSQLLVGGIPNDETISDLTTKTPHVVVGTPGRVYDMLRRGHLVIDNLKSIVLDEADEMLSSGFKEQVYHIFQFMPNKCQIALFSATIPEELDTLTSKFLRDPIKITVKAEQLTLEGIKQYFVALENDEQKYECLKDIYSSLTMAQCIIYCNSVNRVQQLYEAMTNDKFPVCHIHSGMEKQERTDNFNEFKSGKQRVLISTNLTARGIDIQQVSTVINFDVPKCVHKYLHRIGRSGRWGRKGVGINFVTPRDIGYLKAIEGHYSTQIEEMPTDWTSALTTV